MACKLVIEFIGYVRRVKIAPTSRWRSSTVARGDCMCFKVMLVCDDYKEGEIYFIYGVERCYFARVELARRDVFTYVCQLENSETQMFGSIDVVREAVWDYVEKACVQSEDVGILEKM